MVNGNQKGDLKGDGFRWQVALKFQYIPGQEDTAQFFADLGLHVIASLPCYTAKNLNIQRGKGVFDRSIQALLMLNDLGFGKEGTGLKLDLVYNPLGKL